MHAGDKKIYLYACRCLCSCLWLLPWLCGQCLWCGGRHSGIYVLSHMRRHERGMAAVPLFSGVFFFVSFSAIVHRARISCFCSSEFKYECLAWYFLKSVFYSFSLFLILLFAAGERRKEHCRCCECG